MARAPVVIDPNGVYSRADLRAMFGMTGPAIRYAVTRTGLKFSWRLNQQWFLGRWLIEWIDAGAEQGQKMLARRAMKRPLEVKAS